MIKIKFHREKNSAVPVTAKFDNTDTFALFLSFSKDGMKQYLQNMSEQSKKGTMFESVTNYIKGIEEYENDIDECGYEIEGKLRQLEIKF